MSDLDSTGMDNITGQFKIAQPNDTITFIGNVILGDGKNIVLGTSTGTQIGTSSTQKLGFYGKTPSIQPGPWTVSGVTANHTFAAGSLTLTQLQQTVGTLLQDLQSIGIFG